MRKKGANLVGGEESGEDMGGIEEGETIIRVYFMKKTNFSKKNKRTSPCTHTHKDVLMVTAVEQMLRGDQLFFKRL